MQIKKIQPLCQKVGSLVLPPKKTKNVIKEESGDGGRAKEERGDGVWRQGRNEGDSTHLRVKAPSSGKLENPATTKHLRSTRSGTDEVASKTGQHLTKKTSLDRKPLARPKRPVNEKLPDCIGELNDDHEELLAAVNAASNASDVACLGPFWKQVEPVFAFLTQDDLDFLNQLVREVEDVDATMMSPDSNQTGKVQDCFIH
ncbi:hypothetical protein SUGI_1193690 [Cryptomeria japonica]|nr:hypothetical protein SUGI_1193690 [Cryptomeria japonica]